jgi:hypothetical protein
VLVGNPQKAVAFICMVTLNGDRSHNSSNRYPTIRRSDASDARSLSNGLVRDLNSDFNAIQVQAIMKTIQHMAPDDSPLTVLAQQGAKAANLVITEKPTGVPLREPSARNNDRARCA